MALNEDANGLPVPSWGPATKFVAITPNDDTDLTSSKIRCIWVGTAGNIAVLGLNDTVAVTFVNVPDGTPLPLMVKKVLATGTDATDIVGMA